MSKPLTPADYDTMISRGLDVVAHTFAVELSEHEARECVAPVGLYLAAVLFGADATAAQILQCTAAAKAAYLLGRERAGFVGYG